jgi:hypothetical protein
MAISSLLVFSRFRRVGQLLFCPGKNQKAKVQNIGECKGQALTSRSSRQRYALRLNSGVMCFKPVFAFMCAALNDSPFG